MEENDDHAAISMSAMAHKKLDEAKTSMDATKLREVNSKTTHLLGNIRSALINISDLKRAKQWRENVEKLQSEYKMPRFVIGVLGDTGSGKSSLINAVLDEERVVPTNCMRACTAVITEISWNDSDNPRNKYRAEIEFITQAEWTTEVIALHRDILDHDGKLSSDIRNADSDAGIAYSILKSVYPKHTDQQLRDIDPAVLANFTKVREVIGKTKVVEEAECGPFYTKIQAFVDSEEKRNKSGTGVENAEPQELEMAYWPLIKVVRVFLKSEVVSTGVVIVDLPGGRDSNATRAAVAAKYVKECSRLWVVAPITRAVDDKTAKTLMGDHFKQQLKYDGAYNNITFICTKADDIALDEAAPSLGLVDVMAKEQDRKDAMEVEIERKKNELKTLEVQKVSAQEKYSSISYDYDTWNGLHKQVSKGQMTFAPMESPRKRKRSQPRPTIGPAMTKKVKKESDLSDTEESTDDSDLDADESNNDDDGDGPEPLSAAETLKKLEELKASKKTAREEKRQVTRQMAQIKKDIKDISKQRSAIKINMYRTCIQGRNEYSREAIKEDFAFGLKEFDEELLAEQQQEIRTRQQVEVENPDYEEIGKHLPVFCISSRGYQQLRGRMKKDHRVVGFTSLDDTGVPGLRGHTLELAATIQASHFRHHLSEICRLLGALDLFLAGDAANLKLSDNEKKQETKSLGTALTKLGKALGEAVTKCMEDCKAVVGKNVLKKTSKGAAKASEKAVSTAEGWGAKHDAGGLRYGTYKATCRRFGTFKGAAGLRDFNEDLLKPMKNFTAQEWDLAFNSRLPDKILALASSTKHLIDSFHERMKDRRFLVENNDLVNGFLVVILAAQKEKLAHTAKKHQKLIQNAQKDANRLFGPVVQRAMRVAYDDCVDFKGTGSFILMKDRMKTHVESQKDSMFKNAAGDVEKAVNDMLTTLEKTIRDDTKSIVNTMQEDYVGLIGEVASKADNRARKVLSPVLRDFYKNLIVALTPAKEEAATPEPIDLELDVGDGSDDEYQPDEGMSD
ncbi:hypothetical protein CORC01_09030 [Colletotrichum orchidophilum]|uniref:Tat pathway signal sequence n=1 Tax=Colletotrichum orchidophilum TaxID=1209926 RepID=A0A1G4B2F1_9PEZI|nr:uncharacterized protein CORC01_09030 [Colletotrichum orchidophilum]OHE95598.1 hypothetical protein CORC01_09030 [Colletotrichum orchidophilum]